MTVKRAGDTASSSRMSALKPSEPAPSRASTPTRHAPEADRFQHSTRPVEVGAVASREVRSTSGSFATVPSDPSARARQAGQLLEKGGRLMEQGGIQGGAQVRALGAAVGAAATGGPAAPTPGTLQAHVNGAVKATQGFAGAAMGGGLAQQAGAYVGHALGLVSAQSPAPTWDASTTPLGTPSLAAQQWIQQSTAQDPLGATTFQAMATPGTPMNQVLQNGGLDVTQGKVVQPPPVNGMPQIPQVEFNPVTQAQLDAMMKGPPPFNVDCMNKNSADAGQHQNLGLRTNEHFTGNDDTLWRMAVTKNGDGTYKVGFYGEALPKDAVGNGLHVLNPWESDTRKQVGIREGGDRRVGTTPEQHGQWITEHYVDVVKDGLGPLHGVLNP